MFMCMVPIMFPFRFASAVIMWSLRGQMCSPYVARPENTGNNISFCPCLRPLGRSPPNMSSVNRQVLHAHRVSESAACAVTTHDREEAAQHGLNGHRLMLMLMLMRVLRVGRGGCGEGLEDECATEDVISSVTIKI